VILLACFPVWPKPPAVPHHRANGTNCFYSWAAREVRYIGPRKVYNNGKPRKARTQK
jgi:hypothetical protein